MMPPRPRHRSEEFASGSGDGGLLMGDSAAPGERFLVAGPFHHPQINDLPHNWAVCRPGHALVVGKRFEAGGDGSMKLRIWASAQL
jgi:hypothetical protein